MDNLLFDGFSPLLSNFSIALLLQVREKVGFFSLFSSLLN